MKRYDVAIVGAGLFGCVIARALMAQGMTVGLFDSAEPKAGSGPAACLMKPSWLGSMTTEQRDNSMQLLDTLFGVKELDFQVGVLRQKVQWVNPRAILNHRPLDLHVGRVKVGLPWGGWSIINDSPEGSPGEFYLADATHVIVAAGIWSTSVLHESALAMAKDLPKVVGQAGAAFLYKGNLERPFIRPWAPYKQIVGFNRAPNEIWVGDGTSIKAENWTHQRLLGSEARCSAAIDKQTSAAQLMGIRPYVAGAKPCHLVEHAPGLWLATGGAKNGTAAAGWAAHELVRALT